MLIRTFLAFLTSIQRGVVGDREAFTLALTPPGSVATVAVVAFVCLVFARRQNEDMVLLSLGFGKAQLIVVSTVLPLVLEVVVGLIELVRSQ